MAYTRYKYIFRNSNEYEFHWKGRFGAKGEKRAPKKKKTKEQIAQANQINKAIRMRRTLKLNFRASDLWCCFKYPEGTRLTIDEIEKDRADFLKLLRREYRKAGSELKFVSRMEVGERGSVHFHMAVNRIWNAHTDMILNNCWKKTLEKSFKRRRQPLSKSDGLCDYKSMYEEGDFKSLAEYICKRPKDESPEYLQLSLFEPKDQKKLLKISSSRNLTRPESEKKDCKRSTVRKMIQEGPTPTPGYYIDQDSIVSGINPFTGLSYLKYTEIRLDQTDEQPPERKGIP